MTIGVLYAQTAPMEKVQVSKTVTADFPAGGVLQLDACRG